MAQSIFPQSYGVESGRDDRLGLKESNINVDHCQPCNVLIPAPLRRYTNGESKVTGGGGTMAELIDDLEASYPGLRDRIVEDDGEIRRFVNVFVNGENVRKLQGAATRPSRTATRSASSRLWQAARASAQRSTSRLRCRTRSIAHGRESISS